MGGGLGTWVSWQGSAESSPMTDSSSKNGLLSLEAAKLWFRQQGVGGKFHQQDLPSVSCMPDVVAGFIGSMG